MCRRHQRQRRGEGLKVRPLKKHQDDHNVNSPGASPQPHIVSNSHQKEKRPQLREANIPADSNGSRSTSPKHTRDQDQDQDAVLSVAHHHPHSHQHVECPGHQARAPRTRDPTS